MVGQTLTIGVLEIDFLRHRVWVDGGEAVLSGTEYSLLCYLARHAGWVVPHDTLLEAVWGVECVGNLHLLQTTVCRLRRRMGVGAVYLVTRPGLGYCLGPGVRDRGEQPDLEDLSHGVSP